MNILKDQIQRNLDNFSFAENPFYKHLSYQQELESTLKIRFLSTTKVLSTTNRSRQKKSDGFRELCENKPEMAGPRLETNILYL